MALGRFFKKHVTNPLTVLSLDLRAMAGFRAMLGLMLMIDLITRAMDLRAHYSDFGVLPRDIYIEKFANKLHVSLHMASGLVEWQAFLFSITGLAAFCVMIGYRTRLATIISWVLLVSMQNRNTMILNGGDVLFRLMYFWGMFLPLGARFSVDAALNRNPVSQKQSFFSAATIGITIQIAILYWATSMLKTGKEWWPDGTASYYALQLDQFVTPFGKWMADKTVLLHYSTYIVYFLEMCAGFLILCPLFFQQIRTLVIVALVGMHLNFDLTMRLGVFPWIDISALIVLLPSGVWDYLGRKAKTWERLNLSIFYDADCGFCKKTVLLIREFFLVPETTIATAQSVVEANKLFLRDHSWVVRDAEGALYTKWNAIVTVFEHAPIIGWVVKALPFKSFKKAGDVIYDQVAKRRKLLGQWTATILPWRSIPELSTGPLTTFLAVFFTGYIVLWNLRTLPQYTIEMHEGWRRIASVLRLDQKWNMFAPFPLKADGWFVMEGELKDGTTWDIMRGTEGPVSYAKPEYPAYQHPNARWRKFMMNINQKNKKTYRLFFGKYTCRNFNTGTAYTRNLDKFKLFFIKELSRPPGEALVTTKINLWNHDCFKRADTAE